MVEKKPEESSGKAAAWNLAESLIIEIANHLRAASTHHGVGDIGKAFNDLFLAKMRLVQYLTPTERKKFKAAESKIRNALARRNKIEEPEDNLKDWNHYNNIVHEEYESYNEMMMDTLQIYSLSIPDKEFDEGLF